MKRKTLLVLLPALLILAACGANRLNPTVTTAAAGGSVAAEITCIEDILDPASGKVVKRRFL